MAAEYDISGRDHTLRSLNHVRYPVTVAEAKMVTQYILAVVIRLAILALCPADNAP